MLLNLKIYMKDLYVKTCNCKEKIFFPSIKSFFSRFLCDCAIDPTSRELVRDAVLKYQAGTNALINSGIYDTNDDFTVVRQPFMEHMTVPQTVN